MGVAVRVDAVNGSFKVEGDVAAGTLIVAVEEGQIGHRPWFWVVGADSESLWCDKRGKSESGEDEDRSEEGRDCGEVHDGFVLGR